MTKTVEVQEAQERLAELLSEVADGVEVILTQDQTPLARIVSLAPIEAPRASAGEPTTGPPVPGLHVGLGWGGDDFDKPMPAEFWAETESSPRPRTPGLHPGAIWTSDDFDDPLPDEFWLGAP